MLKKCLKPERIKSTESKERTRPVVISSSPCLVSSSGGERSKKMFIMPLCRNSAKTLKTGNVREKKKKRPEHQMGWFSYENEAMMGSCLKSRLLFIELTVENMYNYSQLIL